MIATSQSRVDLSANLRLSAPWAIRSELLRRRAIVDRDGCCRRSPRGVQGHEAQPSAADHLWDGRAALLWNRLSSQHVERNKFSNNFPGLSDRTTVGKAPELETWRRRWIRSQ